MDMSLSGLWELVMDMKDRRAVVHVVTKSWTQVSDWTDWRRHGQAGDAKSEHQHFRNQWIKMDKNRQI